MNELSIDGAEEYVGSCSEDGLVSVVGLCGDTGSFRYEHSAPVKVRGHACRHDWSCARCLRTCSAAGRSNTQPLAPEQTRATATATAARRRAQMQALALDPRFASRKTKEYVSVGNAGTVQLSTQARGAGAACFQRAVHALGASRGLCSHSHVA